MRTLNNLPLWAKMLIAPVVMLVAMLAMAWMTFDEFGAQRADVRRLDAVVFERLRSAMAVTDSVTSFHANLYHLMSVAANESDQNRRATMADALVPQMAQSEALLKALSDNLDETARTRFAPVAKTFAAYKNGALQVADMSKADAAYGAMLMGDAESQFHKLRGLLQEFVADLQSQRATVAAEMTASMDQTRSRFLAILALAVAASAAATIFISRLTARPVLTLTKMMSALAAGDTSIDVPGRDRRDEIGAMAGAVQVFKETALQASSLAAEGEKRRIEQQRRVERVDALASAFERTTTTVIRTVSGAASELRSTASAMAATAEETSRQATAAGDASRHAESNVGTVASAAEELSSTITEIGRQVEQSTTVAGKAVEEAQRTDSAVRGLAEAAQKIGNVVSLINDIASQTNLLALNATIEAARAGDAGKGFAVVASEVKSLANQTAKATEDIAQQVASMQQATSNTVGAIGTIGAIIKEISGIAAVIASAIDQQGAAAREIAGNVQEAAVRTGEVSTNIGGVTSAAADTGAAANQVLKATTQLAEQADALRDEVDRFLAELKAA